MVACKEDMECKEVCQEECKEACQEAQACKEECKEECKEAQACKEACKEVCKEACKEECKIQGCTVACKTQGIMVCKIEVITKHNNLCITIHTIVGITTTCNSLLPTVSDPSTTKDLSQETRT